VTGVDFSKVGLEKASRLAAARGVRADWIAVDLLDYRPDPRAFDLVLIFYLQVPEAQRQPIVRAAADAVAAGGVFLLVGHDRSNVDEGHGGPQNPDVLYTAQDIVADLDYSELVIERAARVDRPVETPDGVLMARDTLVRARRA
jgi:SAM-dependent methyltransferase